MKDSYQMCEVCVMDTSDPEIVFFGERGCNHCIVMGSTLGKEWFNDDSGKSKLSDILEKIKSDGVGKEFDSILGLSGGVDSSYLALKAYDWGLRPLVVHVDGGWNSELAVRNIQSILEFTGWELQTNVINWNEMKELQLSYLKSGVSNQDVPQDHAFFSSLYSFATENSIKYVLSGGNTATEGIFPSTWQWAAMDRINLRAIQKKFGSRRLIEYPTTSFLQYYFTYPILKKMRTLRLLNLIPYVKEDAIVELEKRVGYLKYPGKHGESSFTRFFQGFVLPHRYGMDKRLPHFSSQIVSRQLSRENALNLLKQPLYREGELERDIQFICRKLEISRDELEHLLNQPLRNATELSNWKIIFTFLKRTQKIIEFFIRKRIAIFS
jgi:N-acetyl sugar amidotransferase